MVRLWPRQVQIPLHSFPILWFLVFALDRVSRVAAIAATLQDDVCINHNIHYEYEYDDPCATVPSRSGGASDTAATNITTTGSTYDSLACFLSRLKVELPAQQFHSKIFSLSLENLTCSRFSIAHLTTHTNTTTSSALSSNSSTSRTSPPPPPLIHLDISLETLGAVCTGRYRTSILGVGGSICVIAGQPNATDNNNTAAKTNVELTDESASAAAAAALHWALRVDTSTDNARTLPMPGNIHTEHCTTELHVVELRFTGSISSRIVNVFRSPIADYVNGQINTQLCPNLVAAVDPWLTAEITELETWLDPYLTTAANDSVAVAIAVAKEEDNNIKQQQQQQHQKQQQWIDFSQEAPAWTQFLSILNQNVWTEHLNAGLLQKIFEHDITNDDDDDDDHPSSNNHNNNNNSNTPSFVYQHCGAGFDGWNGILDSIITGGGNIAIALPDTWQHIEFDVNDHGAAHVDIHLGKQWILSGMSHWTFFQLFLPHNAREFSSKLVSTAPITLEMDLTVQVSFRNATSTGRQMQRLLHSPYYGEPPLVESLHVSINVTDLILQWALEVDWRKPQFETLLLDTILQVIKGLIITVDDSTAPIVTHDSTFKLAVQCLLSGMDGIIATQLASKLKFQSVRLSNPSLGSRSSLPIVADGNSNNTNVITNNDTDLERNIDQLINEVINHILLDHFSEYVSAAILGLSSGPIRTILNQAIHEWLDRLRTFRSGLIHSPSKHQLSLDHPKKESLFRNLVDESNVCQANDDLRFPHWVNFSSVDLLLQLNDVLRQPHTLQDVNQYIDCVVDFLVLALQKQFHHVSVDLTKVSDDGDHGEDNRMIVRSVSSANNSISIDLRQLEISRAGSLTSLRVLEPQRNGMFLSTALSFGVNHSESLPVDRDMQDSGNLHLPHFVVGVDVSYPRLNFTSQLNLTFIVNEIELGIGTILQYDLNKLKSLLLQQVARHTECWLFPASEFDWIEPRGQLEYFAFSFNISAQILNMTTPLLLTVDSQQLQSGREMGSNGIFWMVESVCDILNSVTSMLRSRSVRNCEGTSSNSDSSRGSKDKTPDYDMTPIAVILVVIFVLAQPTLILIQFRPQLPDSSNSFSDRESSNLSTPLLHRPYEPFPHENLFDDEFNALENDTELVHEQETTTQSLFNHSSRFVSFSVVIALLHAFMLIVVSHLSTITSVDVSVLLGGRLLSFPRVLEINPSRMGNVLRGAGSNALVLYVGICSVLFSYVRILALLFTWTSKRLRILLRGKMIELTTGMGKFAFAEVYVVSLVMIFFRYHLELDSQDTLDVILSPQVGLWGFLIGAVATSILASVILHFHHQAYFQHRYQDFINLENIEASSILTHGFSVGSGDASRRHLSLWFYVFLVLWCALCLICMGLGVTLDMVSIQVEGLAGEALRQFNSDHKTYSMLNLVTLLRFSAGKQSLHMFGLAILFIVSLFIAPFICLLLLVSLFLVPWKVTKQIRMLSLLNFAMSWSAPEVATLSTLLTVLELPPLVNQVMQQHCDKWLNIISSDDETSPPPECLHMESSVNFTACYLVMGVLLYMSLTSCCRRIAQQAIDERILRSSDPLNGLLLSSQQQNFVHALVTRLRCLESWILAPSNEYYLIAPSPSDGNENGPPLQGNVNTDEPWADNSFDEAWKTAAERDINWKEWKEATNVT